MLKQLILSSALVLSSGLALAQDQKAEDASAASRVEKTDESADSSPQEATGRAARKAGLKKDGDSGEKDGAAAEEAQPSVPLSGDVITLKSGKKLSGVQVLRELPTSVEVEIQPDQEPLQLPRKQIQSIQYDDIDPIKQRRLKALQPPATPPDVIPGEELSQEFNQKLKAPMSDQPLSFKDIGFLVLLKQLGTKAGVEFQIEDSAKQLPKEDRIRSFEIKPGTTLFSFLQTDFLSAYPKLKITYKYDKIIVAGADAAASDPAGAAPPNNPAAPAADGAPANAPAPPTNQ